MRNRLGRTMPYWIVLLIAIGLFVVANRIEFAAPGGRIGPDFWPKVILALAMLTCAYQIVKLLWRAEDADQVTGVLESIMEEAPAEPAVAPEPERRYPLMIAAGIAVTVLYVVAIERLGFFLCTFLYLALFAVIGGYRRPLVVLASSLLGSLVFVFVFMKIVYVSLPIGQEPFSQLTFFLMRLMGIR